MANNGNSTNGAWKIIGPIAATIVLTMVANYFAFFQDMATMGGVEKALLPLWKEVEANRQDIRRLETEVNKSSANVAEIPSMRTEIGRVGQINAEFKGLQGQIDGLRRNFADLRQFIYTTIGKSPPPMDGPH